MGGLRAPPVGDCRASLRAAARVRYSLHTRGVRFLVYVRVLLRLHQSPLRRVLFPPSDRTHVCVRFNWSLVKCCLVASQRGNHVRAGRTFHNGRRTPLGFVLVQLYVGLLVKPAAVMRLNKGFWLKKK